MNGLMDAPQGRILIEGKASGGILVCDEGLSFWGGVDPDTGRIIDVHHPNHGASVVGKVLMMPTSRGSCSGSGVLLELSLKNRAPAALIFCEHEEILSLGALVSDRVFKRPLPTISLTRTAYDRLAAQQTATLSGSRLTAGGLSIELTAAATNRLKLSEKDRSRLQGDEGPALQMAMEIIAMIAVSEGAEHLTDVTRGHIDGCILAHSANLIFAEKLADLGAQVSIPTTINAISVDRENWKSQGVPADFGNRASRLADAYVQMGAQPVFTCAPYLLENAPEEGEMIGWSESNAVIYANSVLGARTPKHPDYLDLFIAMTGRAPASGVYTQAGRAAERVLQVLPPASAPDDSFWPILGWLAGRASYDGIPLIKGVEHLTVSRDDLKALCAAFGTTSGAPMLHVAGHTPEADLPTSPGATSTKIDHRDFAYAWRELNRGRADIDLVAIGSPHASLAEVRRLAHLFGERKCSPKTQMMVTLGRHVLKAALKETLIDRLDAKGVRVIPDLCWCSLIEPVFPTGTTGLMTNSGKYAHYAHGLTGCHAKLGSLSDCVEAAVTGKAPTEMPDFCSA